MEAAPEPMEECAVCDTALSEGRVHHTLKDVAELIAAQSTNCNQTKKRSRTAKAMHNVFWDPPRGTTESFQTKNVGCGDLVSLVVNHLKVHKPFHKLKYEDAILPFCEGVGRLGQLEYQPARSHAECSNAWEVFWASLDKDDEQPVLQSLIDFWLRVDKVEWGNAVRKDGVQNWARREALCNYSQLREKHNAWAVEANCGLIVLRGVCKEFKESVDSYYLPAFEKVVAEWTAFKENKLKVHSLTRAQALRSWLGHASVDLQPSLRQEATTHQLNLRQAKGAVICSQHSWEAALTMLCGQFMVKALNAYLNSTDQYGDANLRSASRLYNVDNSNPHNHFAFSLPIMAAMMQRKCMVHTYLKTGCSITPSVMEGDQANPCFWPVPGTKITLFAKPACVESQCVVLRRGDEPLNAGKKRGCDATALSNLAKQMLNLKGVPAPYYKKECISAMNLGSKAPENARGDPQMQFAMWVEEHPCVRYPHLQVVSGDHVNLKNRLAHADKRTKFTMQGLLHMNRSEMTYCRKALKLQEEYDAETIALQRKRDIVRGLADVERWLMQKKRLPFDSLTSGDKAMSLTFEKGADRIKVLVEQNCCNKVMTRGSTGNAMEVETINCLMRLIYHLSVKLVTHDVRLVTASRGESSAEMTRKPSKSKDWTASPHAYEWFGNLYGTHFSAGFPTTGCSKNTNVWRTFLDSNPSDLQFYETTDPAEKRRYTDAEKKQRMWDHNLLRPDMLDGETYDSHVRSEAYLRWNLQGTKSVAEEFDGITYDDHVTALHVFDATHMKNVNIAWVDGLTKEESRNIDCDADPEGEFIDTATASQKPGLRWRITISDRFSDIKGRIEGLFHRFSYGDIEGIYKGVQRLFLRYNHNPALLLPPMLKATTYKAVSTKAPVLRSQRTIQVNDYETFMRRLVSACLMHQDTKCAAFAIMKATPEHIVEQIVENSETLTPSFAIAHALRVENKLELEKNAAARAAAPTAEA